MNPTPSPHATLFVPGLFCHWAPAVDGDPVPAQRAPRALSMLMARADRGPDGPSGFAPRLFGLFGVPVPEDGEPPVAAVTRLADMAVLDRDWWVRADPVHLEPRRGGLVLHAGLGLDREESERLVAELNEALAADGWLLRAPCPERWYLRPPPETTHIRFTPLDAAVGRDVHPLLPRGPDQRLWHTRLNEIQILLHTSPVNAERETRGRLPANSVWFWGGGCLPQAGRTEWAQLWGDEPLSLGLARLAGIPAQPWPASAAGLLARAVGGSQLFVLEALAAAVQQADVTTWQQALQAVNDDWIAPLMAGVHQGTLDSLSLVSDAGPVFHYRRGHRWRLWRRARPLSAWREVAA